MARPIPVLPPGDQDHLACKLHAPASRCVVENDAESIALSRAQAAYAVPHHDAIRAAGARHRPVVHREDHGLTLPEENYLAFRLGPRPLLDEQGTRRR